MSMNIKSAVATLMVAGAATSFAAQAAFTDLDTGFNASGQITLTDPKTNAPAEISDAAQGADSNLYLIVGTNEIARLMTSGAIDTSFGTNGFLTLASSNQSSAIAVDTAGKRIYLASNQGGAAQNGVAQISAYDFSGAVVPSFGANGVVSFGSLGALAFPSSLQLLSSGSLLMAGTIDNQDSQGGNRSFWAAESSAAGVALSGFGTSGAATVVIPTSISGLGGSVVSYKSAIDASGGVYVVGGSTGSVGLIAKFTSSGQPDATFGTNGVVAQSLGTNAAEFELANVDGSGNVNVFGSYYPTATTGTAVLYTFNSKGAMTASQNGTDSNVPFYPNYVLQSDGKIVFVSGRQESTSTASANIIRLSGSSLLAATAPKTATITTFGGAITISPSAGGVTNAQTAAQPANALTTVTYPFGWMSYNVTGLAPGSSVQVTITLPTGSTASGYEKCENNVCTALSSSVLSINGNSLVLTLTDGGFGDGDGVANGTIVDPGAPTVAAATPIPTPTPTAPATTTNSGDSGGSVDPEMLLPLLAFGLFARRYRRT